MDEPDEPNLRRLVARLLQLKNALDAGADSLWVDYGTMGSADDLFKIVRQAKS
jgi:hypothetical protein